MSQFDERKGNKPAVSLGPGQGTGQQRPAGAAPMPGGQQHPVGAAPMPGGQQHPAGAAPMPGGQQRPAGAAPMPGGQQRPAGAAPMPGGQQRPAGVAPMPGGQQRPAGAAPMPGGQQRPAGAAPMPGGQQRPAGAAPMPGGQQRPVGAAPMPGGQPYPAGASLAPGLPNGGAGLSPSPYQMEPQRPAGQNAGPAHLLYSGAAVAAPGVTTLSDAEKKAIERQTRVEKYAELTFTEKISYSGSLVWSYKSNLSAGCIFLIIFGLLIKRVLNFVAQGGVDSFLGVYGLMFVGSLSGSLLTIGFAAVIKQIVDEGDVGNSIETLFSPFGRLGSILPPLAVLVLSQSLAQAFCLNMAEKSSIGFLLLLLLGVLMVPLNMCLAFYYAEQEEPFGFVEGIVEPLKILAANFVGWLSLWLVQVLVVVVVVAIIYATKILMIGIILGLFWLIGMVVLIFMAIGYIFTYACYIYKQTEARRELGW